MQEKWKVKRDFLHLSTGTNFCFGAVYTLKQHYGSYVAIVDDVTGDSVEIPYLVLEQNFSRVA